MDFNKSIKIIVGILFVIMLFFNVAMYFFIENSVTVFGLEINSLYIQIVFLLLEAFMLSSIYGKKQGLFVCLAYVLLVAANLFYIFFNIA